MTRGSTRLTWMALSLATCASATAPEQPLANPPEVAPVIEVVSESCSLDGLSAYFESDSDTVEAAGARTLDAVLTCLHGPLRDMHVALAGYSDRYGSRAHGHALAQRRANTVRRYLIEHGITADRIRIRSPRIDRDGPRDRARRVDIELLDCATDPARTCS